jgi:hypothetical protein
MGLTFSLKKTRAVVAVKSTRRDLTGFDNSAVVRNGWDTKDDSANVARVHPDLAYSTLAPPHAAGLDLLLPPLAQVKRYGIHILTWWYDFAQKQRDAQLIKRLTKADLIMFS